VKLSVADVMRPAPIALPPTAPLTAAHQAMRAARARHLVVMDGERLAGVVSLDDLHLLESLDDVDRRKVPVEDALVEAYVVSAEQPLAEVGAGMLGRNADVAVVVGDDGHVLGLFTTHEALVALVTLVSADGGSVSADAR
jgi:CBS domain-containing protein